VFETGKTPGFVAEDERDRILAAFAEAVVDRGYPAVTLDAVLEAAGVDAEAFGRHFADLEECFLAAYDAAYDQAFAAAGGAFVNTPGSWSEGARAALERLLDFVTNTPAFAWLCTVEVLHAGPRAMAHRRRSFELFQLFLEPGFAEAGALEHKRVVSEMIAGGIFEMTRNYTVDGRLEQLQEALPAVVVLVLSPFVGRDEAYRLAGLPAVDG
jgi:AcrR family transcriptional regulator